MLNAAKRACRKVTGRGNKKNIPSSSGSNTNPANVPLTYTHVSETSPNENVDIDYEQLQEDIGIEDNEIENETEAGIPATPTSVASSDIGVATRGGGARGRGASSRPPVAPTSNRRKRSKVWNFFEIIPGTDRVKCKLCNSDFKHLTGGNLGGTGTLSRHMRLDHPIEWGSDGDDTQTTLNPTTGGLLKYNKMKDREELAKMIALGCLPFSFASSSYLIMYIQRIYNPLFKGIPRSTCRADIFRLHGQYQTYIRYLFNHLPCRVSLTADIGQAVTGNEYLTITCHWIDDSTCMQKRIIAFKYDEDQSHTAAFISSIIIEVVEFYNLRQKVLCMSFDNASNNNAAVSILKMHLQPPLSEIFHVRCACHIYNLIVKSGLDLFTTEITLVKRAVGVIQGNNRQSRIREFKNKCLEHNLNPRFMPDEIPTRWNYTYIFLKCCYKYRFPITEVANAHCTNPNRMLTTDTWEVISDVVKFLHKFYIATVEFSGAYYPTISSALVHIAEISLLLHEFKKKDGYRAAVQSMQEKFKKYFFPIPPIYLIGAVLNPSIKMSDCHQLMSALYNYMEIERTETPSIYDAMNSLNEHLNQLYIYYANAIDDAARNLGNANPIMECTTSGTGDDEDALYSSYNIFSTFTNTQTSSRNIDELQFYLQKQTEPRTKEFSALGWWQANGKQFPVLYAMARDVLNVPISTVASESAFSQARQQLGDTRHSLGSNALEVLVCFRDWIRSERRNQGRVDVDSPEDEELGDILTHGNPSEFNTPEEGANVHIDYEELSRAMQNL